MASAAPMAIGVGIGLSGGSVDCGSRAWRNDQLGSPLSVSRCCDIGNCTRNPAG